MQDPILRLIIMSQKENLNFWLIRSQISSLAGRRTYVDLISEVNN